MKTYFAFVIASGITGMVMACVGACSGSTTTGTSSGGSASSSQAFIDEFCALTAPCCGRVNKPTDGASCRALFGGLLGARTYDATKGNACLGEIRARSNASDFCDNPTSQAPSCKGTFKEAGTGTAQPGADCSKEGDCASSSEGEVSCASSYSGTATTKSCQIELEGKEGDLPCLKTRDGSTTSYTSSFSSGDGGPQRPATRGYVCDVAKGVYCNSRTMACTKVADIGGACDSSSFDSYACVKAGSCDTQQRKCVARKAVGEDCSGSSQSCVDKANCDLQTRKCVAGLPDGTACTSSARCESNNCTNGTCTGKSGSDLSTQFLCGGN